MALMDCFESVNFLEQMIRNMFVDSKKYRKFYVETFPDIESIKPIPIEVILNRFSMDNFLLTQGVPQKLCHVWLYAFFGHPVLK